MEAGQDLDWFFLVAATHQGQDTPVFSDAATVSRSASGLHDSHAILEMLHLHPVEALRFLHIKL